MTTTDRGASADPGRSAGRGGLLALVVVSAVILLDALDLSITQIALPSIQDHFDLSAASLQWVANAYVLTYGGFLLLGGRLSDLLGRRRMLLCGLALFGVMSLASGLAPDDVVLVVARALQGIGAALTVPAAIAIIATTYPEGRERDRALGVFAAAGSAGFSVGLVLGGVLTDLLDWRWIFLVKVPIVAAVGLLALRAVGPDGAPRRGRSYDLPGAVSSTAGILVLVLMITQLAEPTLPVAAIAVGLAVAVALLIGFVVVERRAADPLLPRGMFANRTLRVADIASLTVLAAPFGLSYICTLYLQEVLGWSALRTSLALLPGAVLSIVVSHSVAPRMTQRFGLRSAGAGGLFAVAAGFALLVLIGEATPYWAVVLPAVVLAFGLGMGVAYPVYTIGGITGVVDERQGVAAGIQSTALQVGGGLGLALVSAGVAAALGGSSDPAQLLGALRVGIVVGAALPLAGALVTLFWMKSEPAG